MHVIVGEQQELLCRKMWAGTQGDSNSGRDSGFTDKGHSLTVSGQEEQSRSSDRNQSHPQSSDHQASL